MHSLPDLWQPVGFQSFRWTASRRRRYFVHRNGSAWIATVSVGWWFPSPIDLTPAPVADRETAERVCVEHAEKQKTTEG